ncbi:MAG: glycosyl hydrolase [Armatimonadetes bacterium]|nr:glycosyl hydrolase [Armatimonadota bacterium]
MFSSLVLLGLVVGSVQDPPQEKQPPPKMDEMKEHHLPKVTAMPASVRMDAYQKRLQMERESIFQGIKWRSVGSEFQGSRVVDVESPMSEPRTLYIAYATGGLWRTEDDGITWKSLFDNESSFAIGDIDVTEDGQTIWVGTGENNSARTHYSGTGVFKSTDRGESWQHMGLEGTGHIGRIVIHPDNPEVVIVAALGLQYSEGEEQGIYKTTNGGRSWKKVAYVDEWTGFVDLVMMPGDPDTLFAAAWHISRRPWNILEGGKGSAVYRSNDGGDTWDMVRALPHNAQVGRTGLAVTPDDPDVVYVYMDNYDGNAGTMWVDDRVASGKLTPWRFFRLNDDLLKEVSEEELEDFLDRRLPEDSDVEEVVKQIKDGELNHGDVAGLLLERNENIFNLRPYNYQIWKTDDKGATWVATAPSVGDQMNYYTGRITVNPANDEEIVIMGNGNLRSTDSGRSFVRMSNRNHVDKHVYWYDPRNPDRQIDGNDGGPYLSMDGGETWRHLNNIPVGQYTTIAVDNKDPYNIYGGLQDNGTKKGPSNYVPGRDPITRWTTVGGGDGSMIAVDPRDDGEVIYTASQFGNHRFFNQATGERRAVRPSGQNLRFNWISPIRISPHHPDILYIGSQYVHRSFDQGRTWETISPDLTKELPRGDVPFSTLTALDESPFKFGVIYVGADDGSVKMTKDGGVTWENIATPATERWVTRIVASQHDAGTVYVTQNGYRQDEWTAYVWKSTDYGMTWQSIADGLPYEPVNTIREDPNDENVLYVGTDLGVFVSLDGGESWLSYGSGMPRAPVHDLVIQERESDMIVGTHSQSVWVIDTEPIADATEEVRAKELHVWEVRNMSGSSRWGKDRRAVYDKREPNEPMLEGRFWSKSRGKAKVQILDSEDKVVKEIEVDVVPGFNFYEIGMQLKPRSSSAPNKIDDPKTLEVALADPYPRPEYVPKGEYKLQVTMGDEKESVEFKVR